MRRVYSILACLLFSHTAVAQVITPRTVGARIDERLATVVLFVDQKNAAASDSNAGTASRPLKTITRAAQMAVALQNVGIGVRVKLRPGTFRESVTLPALNSLTAAPLIFEGAARGETVIKGSDVWSGWTAVNGAYAHAWPYNWGLAPYPAGWECCVTLSDITRRRELIFVNGQPLRQVLLEDDMTADSFFVDEGSRQVLLMLPTNIDMATAVIEVGVRAGLFTVQGRSNVVIRGITFQHDTSPIGSTAAVDIVNASNIIVDDDIITWNNSRGLNVANVTDVSVIGTVANSNGFTGIAGWTLSSALFADGETSYNNWRGYAGGFTDWDPAGLKLLRLRDTVVTRHKADENL